MIADEMSPAKKGGESSQMVCSIDEAFWGGKGWDRRHRKREKRMTDAYVKVGIEKVEEVRLIHRAHSKFVPLAACAHSVELLGRERTITPSGGGSRLRSSE